MDDIHKFSVLSMMYDCTEKNTNSLFNFISSNTLAYTREEKTILYRTSLSTNVNTLHSPDETQIIMHPCNLEFTYRSTSHKKKTSLTHLS